MSEREKILVVDDEPSIRKYLHTLLEVDGYEVEAVASGKEAVQKVLAVRPDAITLNMLMPGKGGWETLFELVDAGLGAHAALEEELDVLLPEGDDDVDTGAEFLFKS